jgi:hypothetical protein
MPIATDTPNARTIELVVTIVDHRQHADQLRHGDPQEDPGDTARQRDDGRLDQELPDHVLLTRADRAPDADLARPLEHAGEHAVHDPDAAARQLY